MRFIKKPQNLGLMLLGVAVYALSLVASPASLAQSPFAGVYTGTFSGAADNGQFAILVRTNNTAIVMAFDAFDQLGFVNRNVTINPNGTFFNSNIDGDGTSGSGSFTLTGVSGTFMDPNNVPGTFTGTKRPATGIARNIGGFYLDALSWPVRFNGVTVGSVTGDWFLLIAADGTFFEVIEATLFVQVQGQTLVERIEGGGLGAASSIEQVCQSVSGAGFSVTCTFNPNTFTFAGTVFASDQGVMISGPYSLTRSEPLPDLPPIAVDDAYLASANRSLTVDAAEGVLANDSDPEGDPLTALVKTGPTQGILSLNADGSFTYTPNPRFIGTDSFTYRAAARSLQSAAATVTIKVNLALPWLSILLDD
jgi:hypothetical protein